MSIGQTLAEARERAGLTVEDVAKATRIRRTLVSNIESDDFSACGGDFYARGHVRSIAQKVGVDPAPLMAEFDAERGGGVSAPRATEVFEPAAARPDRRGPNWSAAMALALVLVLGYGVAQVLSGGETEVPDGLTTGQRPTAGAQQSARPTASPAPTAESSAVARAPRDKVTVAVAATGTSWVQVTTDSGKELFQGLLTDETRSFTDKTRLRLVIGNAGAVALTVNGTPVGAPGKAGQVVRAQFTPEDPAAG